MIYTIQHLKENPGITFAGEYRLRGYQTFVSRSGARYGKGVLEDASGEMPLLNWSSSEPAIWDDHDVMSVEGLVQRLDYQTVVKIRVIEDRLVEGTDRGIQLVPHSYACDPKVLQRCIGLVEQIDTPALQRFCNALFCDLDFARLFFSVPASRNHHHAFPGGLAAHSVAVAETAARYPRLSRKERDLAIVGGLVHDAGKVITHDPARSHAVYLDHDLLALERLSDPLKVLDNADPDLADHLRHILTWKRALPETKPGTLPAIAVHTADCHDAAANGGTAPRHPR